MEPRPSALRLLRSLHPASTAADRLSDIAADRSSDRLRQLSDEVSRIASTLARLSTGPDATSRPAPALPTGDVPPVAGEQVRQGHPCAASAQPVLRGGFVRRSGVGHASRPASGRNRPASRAGVEPVHRCCGASNDGAALAENDDGKGDLRSPGGSTRWPAGVRRAVARRQHGNAPLLCRGAAGRGGLNGGR